MVFPSGNPLQPQVASRSRPSLKHQVVLDAYRGNGSCECEHFVCRLEPRLQKGELPSDVLRCSHIAEARAHLLDEVIRKIAKG